MKDEFYIGYIPKAEASFDKKVRLFIGVLAVTIPILAFLIVGNQRGYPTSTFELGQLTTLEGILTTNPVPMLKMIHGQDHLGAPIYQSVLLIGFGKFGAEKTLTAIEQETGQKLEGKMVQLEGTLIYHDGKTLLELTKKTSALKEVGEVARSSFQKKEMGSYTFDGEIADPKCFFGVMKPGEGKPHRSCAVRCISGGIPPVLKTTNTDGQNQYFILLGPGGEPINQAVLNYVGIPLKISGELVQYDDWLVLKTDLQKDIRGLGFQFLEPAPMCKETQLLSQVNVENNK